MTLPLIYTLNNCSASTRREIIYILKNKNKDMASVQKVIGIVVETGGIVYATEKMNDFYLKAKDILYEFPESNIRKGLENLVTYVKERNY